MEKMRIALVAAALAAVPLGAGAEKMPPLPEGAFTYAVIPDTQSYDGEGRHTKYGRKPGVGPTRNEKFDAIVDWLVANAEKENIRFVSHTGDIVDMNNDFQWRFASNAMSRLDGKLPYAVVPGNHDMTDAGDTSLFNRYFPASRYKGHTWYAGAFGGFTNSIGMFVSGGNANSICLFGRGDEQFAVVSLECNAPDPVLKWAAQELERFPDRRVIVATHQDLGAIDKKNARKIEQDTKGLAKDELARYAPDMSILGRLAWHKRHGKDGNSGRDIWEKFTSRIRNAFLVVSGDQGMIKITRVDERGAHGNMVYSLMQDTGGGFIRIFRFVPAENVVRCYTIDPRNGGELVKSYGVWHDSKWFNFDLPYPAMPEDFVRVAARRVECAATEELIRNGSFEEVKDGKAVGWPAAKHYAVAERGGMNGTRGVAYENSDEKDFRALLTQNVKFEPGKRYRFSVWQKTENLTRPPTICVEWSDANGRHLGGMYAPGVAGTHDWAKIESMTMPIPPDAAKVRLCTYVKKGGLGKAWFDDVSMTEVVDEPFGGLFSSAYRDAASSGKVLFRAPVNAGRGARATFSWTDAAGGRRTSDVAVSDDDFADLELDVAALAPGTQKVTCEVFSATGARVGGGERAFTRTDGAHEPKVRFDRAGRTLVDGRPFFPLGMYVDKIPEGEALDVYTNSPFNCMMPYGEPDAAAMDRAQVAGQKIIYPIHKYHPFKKRRAQGADTPEAADALAGEKIKEFKGHPALLAWYACDETAPEHIPALTRRQNLIARADPDHPTWTVLYQYGIVRGYYPSFDVIGTDPYPVPETSIGLAAEWAGVTRSEVMGLKPMWQVVQAFDWKDYGRAKGRMPTREEMTAMTWHALANGANGIVYYHHRLLYRGNGERGTGKRFLRDRWEDICAAAETVRRFVPAFLSAETAPAATCPERHVSVRTLRQDGKLLLIATSSKDEPSRARISFPDPIGVPSVEAGHGVEATWRGTHEVELTFGPQGWGVVTFGEMPKCEKLPPLPDDAFTYAVIPDTQLYRGEGALVKPGMPKQKGPTRNPAFASRVAWIERNLAKEKIAFVSHVGDIIDARNPLQWAFASNLMSHLDGKVPYGISVGNHDSEGGDTVKSGFTKAFPASRYACNSWYVGQRGDNANSCQLFEAGGMKFVMLHLECNAPDDVLDWADGMLEKYRDRMGIIVTHMYLGYLTKKHDTLQRKHQYVDPPGYSDWFGVMAWKKVHGEKGTTAQEMWDRHFSKHANLFLILCGDQSMATAWRHLQFGRNGNRVYSVLQDYPRKSDGEDWLRLFRFRPSKGVVEVYTYSPSQDRLCDDAGFWHGRSWHQFELPLPAAH